MLIVNADVLSRAAKKYRDAASAIRAWTRIVEGAIWHSIADVHQIYPSADGVVVGSGAIVTIFNVRGNNYRLLTYINYRAQVLKVIELLTHAEYNKNLWKDRL